MTIQDMKVRFILIKRWSLSTNPLLQLPIVSCQVKTPDRQPRTASHQPLFLRPGTISVLTGAALMTRMGKSFLTSGSSRMQCAKNRKGECLNAECRHLDYQKTKVLKHRIPRSAFPVPYSNAHSANQGFTRQRLR